MLATPLFWNIWFPPYAFIHCISERKALKLEAWETSIAGPPEQEKRELGLGRKSWPFFYEFKKDPSNEFETLRIERTSRR